MKIPVNWLREYIKLNKNAEEIAQSFTLLGLLLDKPIEKVGHMNVLDLEHRMDRADWLGILGCARDLAAFENVELVYPEIDKEKREHVSDEDKVEVTVDDQNDLFVNRFYTRVFKNIKVQPSPSWMQERLEAYGLPSINNIVDITNYVMVELGQPMHAHDLDKMETKEIKFRKAKDGEKIKTLLGETLELDDQTYITTNNDKPTGIGGIVGGTKVAIDDTTKNIVLDSGNYNQNLIRKTSRKLKIQNETVLRDDKFLHPYNNELAIKRATQLILELAGDEVEVYENGDYFPNQDKWIPKTMTLRKERVKKLSGLDLDMTTIRERLGRLEYIIKEEGEETLEVTVPYFRTDVEVEDDLAADVLRIGDYSKIPLSSINTAPPKEITSSVYKFEDKLRDILVKMGLHEHITDPLVKAEVSTTEEKDKRRIHLENALSEDKNALRTSLYETLKPVLSVYQKHQITEVAVFELGLIYFQTKDSKTDYNSYAEQRVLEVLYANSSAKEYSKSKEVKRILATLLYELGIKQVDYVKENNRVDIVVGDHVLGEITSDSFRLDTQLLLGAHEAFTSKENSSRVLHIIPNEMTEDITIKLPLDETAGKYYQGLMTFDENITKVSIIDEYIDGNNKAITFRLTIKNKLEDKEFVSTIKDKLKNLKDGLGLTL